VPLGKVIVLDNIRHTTYTQSMIRTQVYLPEELYNDVKLLSLSGEGNFSDLLREGLKTVVKAKAKSNRGTFAEWKSFIGACKTDFGGKSGQDLINDYYKNDVV
jgi:hypothetical protein